MGCTFSSQNRQNNFCNYYCPICQQSGKTPNQGGRFFIINQYQYQCNGCNQIFEKYDIVISNFTEHVNVEIIEPPMACIQLVDEFSDTI